MYSRYSSRLRVTPGICTMKSSARNSESLGIAGLVRVVVVKVELLEDRQIFSGLRGVAHVSYSFCVRFGGRRRCAQRPPSSCKWLVSIRGAVLPTVARV